MNRSGLLLVGVVTASLALTPPAMAGPRPSLEEGRRLQFLLQRYEALTLDASAASEEVRRAGHFAFTAEGRRFDLDLVPHDLRAPGYEAQETGLDGVRRSLAKEDATTVYKGTVRGWAGAQARFTIDEKSISGMILTGTERYFLEPARRFSPRADAKDYLFYRASDTILDSDATCGATPGAGIGADDEDFAASGSSVIFSPDRVLELATEADYEFVSGRGGSTNANNEILSLLNQVEAIYERDLGITFTVVFQHTWSTPADPYTSKSAQTTLAQFRDFWNTTFGLTQRDLTHLWSGKTFNGGLGGIAYRGVLCSDANRSYSLTKRFGFAAFNVGVPAHEIGHNFGATHPEDATPPRTECNDTLMDGSFSTTFSQTFCQFSVDEISTYLNGNSGGNSACLATASP